MVQERLPVGAGRVSHPDGNQWQRELAEAEEFERLTIEARKEVANIYGRSGVRRAADKALQALETAYALGQRARGEARIAAERRRDCENAEADLRAAAVARGPSSSTRLQLKAADSLAFDRAQDEEYLKLQAALCEASNDQNWKDSSAPLGRPLEPALPRRPLEGELYLSAAADARMAAEANNAPSPMHSPLPSPGNDAGTGEKFGSCSSAPRPLAEQLQELDDMIQGLTGRQSQFSRPKSTWHTGWWRLDGRPGELHPLPPPALAAPRSVPAAADLARTSGREDGSIAMRHPRPLGPCLKAMEAALEKFAAGERVTDPLRLGGLFEDLEHEVEICASSADRPPRPLWTWGGTTVVDCCHQPGEDEDAAGGGLSKISYRVDGEQRLGAAEKRAGPVKQDFRRQVHSYDGGDVYRPLSFKLQELHDCVSKLQHRVDLPRISASS